MLDPQPGSTLCRGGQTGRGNRRWGSQAGPTDADDDLRDAEAGGAARQLQRRALQSGTVPTVPDSQEALDSDVRKPAGQAPAAGGGAAAGRGQPPPGADTGLFQPTSSNYVVARQNVQYAEGHRDDTPDTAPFSSVDLARALDYASTQGAGRPRSRGPTPGFSFSEMDSATAAQFLYHRLDCRFIAIMNFANGSTPGGGYLSGARAQEEALCRQWPLYHASLYNASRRRDARVYPFGAYQRKVMEIAEDAHCSEHCLAERAREIYTRVLVTPEVQLMRAGAKDNFRALQPGEGFPVTMVAATAPKARWRAQGSRPLCRLEATIINTILAPLIAWKTARRREPPPERAARWRRVLILGAWGCGAFGNNPADMVERFMDALSTVYFSGHYGDLLAWLADETDQDCPEPVFYHEIHFAVPAFREADQPNVECFRGGLQRFVARHGLEGVRVHRP